MKINKPLKVYQFDKKLAGIAINLVE